MPIIERDVVMTGKDGGGNLTMDFPITRLGNVEDTADVKAAPAAGDYIPVVDASDGGQMKKTLWSAVAALFAAAAHRHTKSEITDFPTSMPASDVPAWAKAAVKPTYTASEVGAKGSGWKPYHVGTSAPADTTQLWIDTAASTGGLKYHNGSAWVHVPVAYT